MPLRSTRILPPSLSKHRVRCSRRLIRTGGRAPRRVPSNHTCRSPGSASAISRTRPTDEMSPTRSRGSAASFFLTSRDAPRIILSLLLVWPEIRQSLHHSHLLRMASALGAMRDHFRDTFFQCLHDFDGHVCNFVSASPDTSIEDRCTFQCIRAAPQQRDRRAELSKTSSPGGRFRRVMGLTSPFIWPDVVFDQFRLTLSLLVHRHALIASALPCRICSPLHRLARVRSVASSTLRLICSSSSSSRRSSSAVLTADGDGPVALSSSKPDLNPRAMPSASARSD